MELNKMRNALIKTILIAIFSVVCFGIASESFSFTALAAETDSTIVSLDAKKITDAEFELSSTTVTYNGKTLKKGTDYTVSYSNNTKIGKATVKVTGKGSYTGTKKLTFKIIPKKVTNLTTTAGQTRIKLSWSKVATCTGYKIYRYNSSTKKWEGVKNISSKTTTSWTDNSRTPNKTYKYIVKAYKTVNGVTYVSKGVKISVKTKKATTPLALNGQLSVSGANIVNSSGEKFQILGMSTHGIMWEDYSDILSKASLKVLRDDWGINTIRIAMYTEEWGGYTTSSAYALQARKKIYKAVETASSLGLYVIIDWHILNDGNPQTHQSEAIKFFKIMAKRYKNYNNIIYEICNEPNGSGVTWSGNIKPYAKKVIAAIRKYDDDALIICGTPTWSQDIDDVVNNRLSDKNTVYALHFYANTHTDWLRTRFSECYSSGLPILVSEFGTCNSSGDGGYNSTQTKTWLKLLDSKKIGYVNWSASSKSETASAFKSGTNLAKIKSGTSQLTSSGKLIRSWYRKRAGLS